MLRFTRSVAFGLEAQVLDQAVEHSTQRCHFLLAQREFMPDRYSRNLLAVMQSFEALPAHQTGATE